MTFEHPQFLLFFILLAGAWRHVRAAGRPVLAWIRMTLCALAILALARPALDLSNPGLDITILADRSLSVGTEGAEEVRELLQLVDAARRRASDSRVRIIGFGANAQVEAILGENASAASVSAEPAPNGSNLAAALSLAAAQEDPTRQGRLLILSDGLYTGTAPRRVRDNMEDAREIWYRRIGRPRAGDVAAVSISLPPRVEAGAGFLVRFTIQGPDGRAVRYTLTCGERIVADNTVRLREGRNHFAVRDMAAAPGMAEYHLRILSENDPEPANDTCTALVQVGLAPRVLLVNATGRMGILDRILAASGIPCDRAAAAGLDWSPARLAAYRAVILENCPIQQVGFDGARSLAQAVESGLCALLVTGGEQSFGEGGYHKSPIDSLLPVSMELRQEQRRGMLALVTALDRSGSMACPAGGGKTKMDLANIGTASAIELLSPLDQVAVIAVDSAPHIIVPLSRADDTRRLISAVLRIESTGGGIFVRTALEAAEAEIMKSKIPSRHVILFADAADSEEQDGCLDIAARFVKNGIGLGVVALGSPTDCDAHFLRQLAAAGKGEIYFTVNPGELPRLFSQEVIRVSRRGFIKDPTRTNILPDIARLQLPLSGSGPDVSAYNLTSLRRDASCALASADEFHSPLLAFWQRDRTLAGAVLVDLDGPYTGSLYAWKEMPRLVGNLVRFLSTAVTAAPASAWTQCAYGEAEIRLEFDEETARRLRAEERPLRLLSPDGGDPIAVPLTWDGPVQAVARAPLTRHGHYLPTLDLGSGGVVRAPAASMPYSPEFLPRDSTEGERVLDELAKSTNGRVLATAEDLFAPVERPARLARRDLSLWPALLFVFTLILEVAERRLAASDWLRERRRRRKTM